MADDEEQARREAAEELWGRLRMLEEQNKAMQLALFVVMDAAIAAGANGPRLIASLQGFAAERQRMGEEAGVALLDRLIVGLETLEQRQRDQSPPPKPPQPS